MSEATPDRTITGLGAQRARLGVHPDASRLLARNRAMPTSAEQAGPGLELTPIASAPAGGVGQHSIKQQLNVSIPRDVRARIRAAYRATAATEGHRSFSDFIAAIVEAEARRLETQYNNGRPFAGGEIELVSGRPMGD